MSFATGVRCFLDGASAAFGRPLRGYVLLPGLVSFLVVVGGLVWALSYVTDFSAYLQRTLGAWPEFLQWVVEPLLYLIGIFVGAWSFGFLAIVIGSPFLGNLSARVDTDLPEDGPGWLQVALATLAREGRKLLYSVPRLIGLLILGFIPVLNLIAPVLWVLLGAWLMAVQFCDFPFENRHQPFQDTRATLRNHRGAALGFGACVTLAMAVPVLNFMVPPVATIGGTMLVNRLRPTAGG